ncbi:hypothetical protein V494_02521 [Pseudogymnoascus sp. VKM F-4513 (FW-928)]|nr:hypothetical protein V494_02521 [Pseudogymnoascus sp. VKM F-4513 (FW-928)]
MMLARYGLLLSLCVPIAAAPYDSISPNDNQDLHQNPQEHDVSRRAEDFYLRIMPLGASITKGSPAAPGTNGNGYRKDLRDNLVSDGWKVNMVGSQPFGKMADNQTEGYPGLKVSQIQNFASPSIAKYKPNLILINAGTNDAVKRDNIAGVGTRMEKLILDCFAKSPNTVVILSTLIPNGQANKEVKQVNAQYRALAKDMKGRGLHVMLAEMNNGFITLKNDIWTEPDGTRTHPNVGGFKKMATVWGHAIDAVLKEDGWLKAPTKVSSKNGKPRAKSSGGGNENGN